jgi:hypothetical protein
MGPQFQEHAEKATPACRPGQAPVSAAAERHDAEPVAALRGQVADGDRHALRDVGLAPIGCPEGHRRRDVEQEPRRERPLGHVDTDVRDARPGRHVPVDAPDVVAGLVRTDLGELGAAAEVVGAVLPGDEAADPAPDGQVERAQEHLGSRARSRTLLRTCSSEER